MVSERQSSDLCHKVMNPLFKGKPKNKCSILDTASQQIELNKPSEILLDILRKIDICLFVYERKRNSRPRNNEAFGFIITCRCNSSRY